MAKFMVCKHCGNMTEVIHDAGVKMICCGEPMQEIQAGVVDAAVEKHLPVVAVDGKTVSVTVGSVQHPMSTEHLIDWIYLETDRGSYKRVLSADDKPEVKFNLSDEKPLSVYAYCNLHGLWKTEV